MSWVRQDLWDSPGWGKECEPGWWRLRYGATALWLCVGEGSEEVQWLLSAVLSGRTLSPSCRPHARHFSSSLYVSGAAQAAFTPHWSSGGVNPSKFVCWPFKRNFLELQKLPSSSDSIPAGFYSQKLWVLLFLALEPWAGDSGVGLGPSNSSGGTSLPIFIHYTWVWDQTIPRLQASYQFQCSFLIPEL